MSRYALVFLLLLMLSVPWYWPAQWLGYVWGIPYWVLCSLSFVFLAACLTAYRFLSGDGES